MHVPISVKQKIKITFAFYQPGYRVPGNWDQESPDSKEQHTGEQPASRPGRERESATENYCLLPLLKERVGVRLKT